jgi:uncharacterized protein (DUF983 family)
MSTSDNTVLTEPSTDSVNEKRPSLIRLLRCACLRRCPKCAKGPLFRRFFTLYDKCPACGYDLQPADGNTWFFMYFSSGGIVGAFFLYMYFFPPASAALGWLTIVPLAGLVMILSLPLRKAMAIAIDFFIDPEAQENLPDDRE